MSDSYVPTTPEELADIYDAWKMLSSAASLIANSSAGNFITPHLMDMVRKDLEDFLSEIPPDSTLYRDVSKILEFSVSGELMDHEIARMGHLIGVITHETEKVLRGVETPSPIELPESTTLH